ncbi:hypothetical protein JW960_12170 [candidate division KSB1 bacterium]|nr:hypothetical protein [candidate division KSB1 bacterium]
MNQSTIGIFSYHWNPDWIIGKTRIQSRWTQPWSLYKQVLWYKARPRREAYMQELFETYYPDGIFINIDNEPDWQHHIVSASTIVLLYPDATGLGFMSVERTIWKQKRMWANIKVMNGRRRQFVINWSVYIQLLIRRILERTMLIELCATIPFVLITPILLLIDQRRHAHE